MPKKNLKVKNVVKNVEVKKMRMTVPANGFEQIKSNPFFFTKQSSFFNHLQDVRNRTRSLIRNNQYEE